MCKKSLRENICIFLLLSMFCCDTVLLFLFATGLLKDIKRRKTILISEENLSFVLWDWEFVENWEVIQRGVLGAAMHLSPTREPTPHDNKTDILRRRANCSAMCGSPTSPWCNDLERWIWRDMASMDVSPWAHSASFSHLSALGENMLTHFLCVQKKIYKRFANTYNVLICIYYIWSIFEYIECMTDWQ